MLNNYKTFYLLIQIIYQIHWLKYNLTVKWIQIYLNNFEIFEVWYGKRNIYAKIFFHPKIRFVDLPLIFFLKCCVCASEKKLTFFLMHFLQISKG